MLWRGLKGWTYEHGDMSKTDGQSGLHDPKLPSHLRPKFLGSFLGQQKIRDFMKPLLNLNLWYLIDENSWGFIKILLILLQVLVLNKKSAMFIILFIHILHFGDSYTLLTRSQPCVSSFLDLVTSFQQRGWNILEHIHTYICMHWKWNAKYWYALSHPSVNPNPYSFHSPTEFKIRSIHVLSMVYWNYWCKLDFWNSTVSFQMFTGYLSAVSRGKVKTQGLWSNCVKKITGLFFAIIWFMDCTVSVSTMLMNKIFETWDQFHQLILSGSYSYFSFWLTRR